MTWADIWQSLKQINSIRLDLYRIRTAFISLPGLGVTNLLALM